MKIIDIEIGNKTIYVYNPKTYLDQEINKSTGIVEHESFNYEYEYCKCAIFNDNGEPVQMINDYTPSKSEEDIIEAYLYDHQ